MRERQLHTFFLPKTTVSPSRFSSSTRLRANSFSLGETKSRRPWNGTAGVSKAVCAPREYSRKKVIRWAVNFIFFLLCTFHSKPTSAASMCDSCEGDSKPTEHAAYRKCRPETNYKYPPRLTAARRVFSRSRRAEDRDACIDVLQEPSGVLRASEVRQQSEVPAAQEQRRKYLVELSIHDGQAG